MRKGYQSDLSENVFCFRDSPFVAPLKGSVEDKPIFGAARDKSFGGAETRRGSRDRRATPLFQTSCP